MSLWFGGKRLDAILAPDCNSFGIVRLLAALAVVVSHNFAIHSGEIYAEPIYVLTGFSLGKHAVHVFFVLSGLLVCMSLHRSASIVDYLRSRMLRIYPGFLVCVLVCALVLGPAISNVSFDAYWRSSQVPAYLVQTLGLISASERLPGVFTSNPYAGEVNLSLWTIKYEVFCYLLLAAISALGFLRTPRRATFVLGGLVLLASASYLVPGLVKTDSLADSLRRFIMCFSLGALAFVHRDRLLLSAKALLLLLLLLMLAQSTSMAVPLLLVATAYGTLFAASFRAGQTLRWTERTDLSFGVYLYGWPCAQVILVAWPSASLWNLQVLCMATVVPLAAASWYVIERPALRIKQKAMEVRMSRRLASA